MEEKEKDQYHDREVTDRDRSGRMTVAVMFSAFVLIVPMLIILWASPFDGLAWNLFFAGIGLGVGSWVLGKSFHLITIYVPIVQGLVTQDMFSGERVVYGPGLHARYPWEEIHKESNVSLKTVTKVLSGMKFPVKDDEVVVELSYQWAADLKILQNFISVAPSTIEEGFDSLFENLLAEKLAGLMVDEATTEEVISECNTELKALYESADSARDIDDRYKKQKKTLESQYGIDLKMVRVERITPSKEVLEARAAAAESGALHKRIAEELGYDNEKKLLEALRSGELDRKTYEKARETLLIMSEEIRKDIKEFNIPGLPEFGQALGKALGEKFAGERKGDKR